MFLGHKHGKQSQIIESLFYSYFIEGKDIGNMEELLIIAQQNNICSNTSLQYLESNIDKKKLLQEDLLRVYFILILNHNSMKVGN